MKRNIDVASIELAVHIDASDGHHPGPNGSPDANESFTQMLMIRERHCLHFHLFFKNDSP